ncbi:putative sodium-coupled monocarboxylate transporter 2-like [Apostichopus japonicus]|uniref:Putative sodium-coupled monocarboxylate transporter 2-like n=1 Tax=Stichopus japonicus TaxID=307972 RepID=A0A2G8KM03_STIJA|nr:putative sodium-coupled monocarboxylate transporter 2-like [Apostichopus japonicus]
MVSTCIGIYYALAGGRQRTTKEFLLADRNMNPVPVALSLVASFISAITVLGTPAEVYRHNTMFWVICFAYIATGVITSRTFMTIFYEYEITSTNEYLERRFNKNVRYVGTFLFFLQMVLYLGIVIYAPALALNAVTGLSLWGSVLTIGVVCTFYTTIGGLKAVLWTDVFQVCIMVAGLLAVIIQGSIKLGGLREAWKIAESRDRIDFWNFSFDPTVRHTFWALSIGQTFTWCSSYGVNQAQVQRYLSCGKKSTAQLALGMAIVGMIIVVSLACLAGVVTFAFYADCDPYTMERITAVDQIVPYFVMELFGDRPGLPGLFTSCVFSAALSTVSSGLNSLAAITGEDIIKSIWPDMSEKRYTIAIKLVGCRFWYLNRSGHIHLARCRGKHLPPDSNPPGFSTAMCDLNATTAPQFLTTTSPVDPSDAYPPIASFYALSYCWYSGLSWCVCVLFGLLISFATGHNKPSEADVSLHRPIVDSFLCCLPPGCTDICRCGVEQNPDIKEKPDGFYVHEESVDHNMKSSNDSEDKSTQM